jgi:3-dehydroquinate synthase
MKSNFQVSSKLYDYDVYIGINLIKSVISKDMFILTDERFEKYVSTLSENVITVDSQEHLKSLETCEVILNKMVSLQMHRKSTLVAIGGGVIQDLATMVASIYMRGIRWVYFPTTLMSMMDSCVGGKSSINVGTWKNLVGNFYPPSEIYIDVAFIKSLDTVAIASGVLEGLKICYAQNLDSFSSYKKFLELASKENPHTYISSIEHSLKTKKWFVEEDEKDEGVRQLLNFGHTFGHALESATGYLVPHGIAIGIGMLTAFNFSGRNNGLTEWEIVSNIRVILKGAEFEVEKIKLSFEPVGFMSAFNKDKKHTTSHYKLVLPTDLGLELVGFDRTAEIEEKVLTSMQNVLDSL